MADFAEMFPERFNNKTNGVTPRRWLLLANPDLAGPAHRGGRRRLGHRPGGIAAARAASPDDAGFRERVPGGQAGRQGAVRRLDQGDGGTSSSTRTSIFDSQIKRIHEYKRQLLNVLQIVVWYNRLRAEPGASTRRRGRSCSPARRPRPTASPS